MASSNRCQLVALLFLPNYLYSLIIRPVYKLGEVFIDIIIIIVIPIHIFYHFEMWGMSVIIEEENNSIKVKICVDALTYLR